MRPDEYYIPISRHEKYQKTEKWQPKPLRRVISMFATAPENLVRRGFSRGRYGL